MKALRSLPSLLMITIVLAGTTIFFAVNSTEAVELEEPLWDTLPAQSESPKPPIHKAGCFLPQNPSLAYIRERISNSSLAYELKLSCREWSQIYSIPEHELLATTGRSQGAVVLCLSNDKDDPCKHKLAYFSANDIPSVMLVKLLGSDQKRTGPLTETVERLYIRPSRLLLK